MGHEPTRGRPVIHENDGIQPERQLRRQERHSALNQRTGTCDRGWVAHTQADDSHATPQCDSSLCLPHPRPRTPVVHLYREVRDILGFGLPVDCMGDDMILIAWSMADVILTAQCAMT